MDIKIRSGAELMKIIETYYFISTGSIKLDNDLLYGGIRSSALNEINGLSGCGKTQLCLELLLNAIMPNGSLDPTLDYRAVYVSTRKCFFPDRMKQVLEQYREKYYKKAENGEVKDFNSSDIFKRILYKQAFEIDELTFTINYLYSMMQENKNSKNIRLIIIDSFSTHIRDLRGWTKTRMICELTQVLSKTAHEFNCAIVLTNDMTVRAVGINRKTNEPKFSIKPCLGDIFLHIINQSICLEKTNDVITATTRKSIKGGPKRTKFTIDQRIGITDIEQSNETPTTSNSEKSDDENSSNYDDYKCGPAAC